MWNWACCLKVEYKLLYKLICRVKTPIIDTAPVIDKFHKFARKFVKPLAFPILPPVALFPYRTLFILHRAHQFAAGSDKLRTVKLDAIDLLLIFIRNLVFVIAKHRSTGKFYEVML